MSKQIKFPITHCPYCNHDQFHNNIGMSGVTRVTYNNQGKPIETKMISINYSGVRDTWFCNQCEKQVFHTKDCQ